MEYANNKSSKELRIFLASPSYDGLVHHKTAKAMYASAAQKYNSIHVASTHASLLAHGFNILWCNMLNLDPPMNRWAMLHGDIEPENWWLDILLDELEETGADAAGSGGGGLAPMEKHGSSLGAFPCVGRPAVRGGSQAGSALKNDLNTSQRYLKFPRAGIYQENLN